MSITEMSISFGDMIAIISLLGIIALPVIAFGWIVVSKLDTIARNSTSTAQNTLDCSRNLIGIQQYLELVRQNTFATANTIHSIIGNLPNEEKQHEEKEKEKTY